MYYAKPVEMVFDIVCLDYDFDKKHLYSPTGPFPTWVRHALAVDEKYNKLVVEDVTGNTWVNYPKILTLYNKNGSKSCSDFPVFVSYNPIFGIEFLNGNPDNSLKGDWKRVCGIQNNPFD